MLSRTTEQIVRKRAAEQEALEEAMENGEWTSRTLWPFPEEVVHEFPTRICSIHVAHSEQPSFGRKHSACRICVRTQSSTVFASLQIPLRVLHEGENLFKVRLVGLMEVLHGQKLALQTFVKGPHRASDNFQEGKDKVAQVVSSFRITDVSFHPFRHDVALTIDSKGNVARFECDENDVTNVGWSQSVRWKGMPPRVDRLHSLLSWNIDWLAEDSCCVLSDARSVYIARLDLVQTEKIYQAKFESPIVCAAVVTEPISMCWVLTTSEVILFDMRPKFMGQELLSCLHQRARGHALKISCVTPHPFGSTIILSSALDPLLSTICVKVSLDSPIASLIGEVGVLPSALSPFEPQACAPLIFNIKGIDKAWMDVLRGTVRAHEDSIAATYGMLQVSQQTDLWLTGLCAGAIENRKDTLLPAEYTGNVRLLAEIVATRTIHPLHSLYKVLFDNKNDVEADEAEMQESRELMTEVERWLGSSIAPEKRLLLTLADVFAFCGSGTGELESLSVFHQLLSKQIQDFAEPSRILNDIKLATQNLPWSGDLGDILHSQLLLGGQDSGNSINDLNTISQRITRAYSSKRGSGKTLSQLHREELANENVARASKELAVDLLLSSTVFCKTPTFSSAPGDRQPDEGDVDSQHEAPALVCSFFQPKADGDSDDPGDPFSEAAKHLLSEWTLGSDPTTYSFTHPYDEAENERQNNSRQSSRPLSQTPLPSPRHSSRQRQFTPVSSSSRAVSEFPELAPNMMSSMPSTQPTTDTVHSQLPNVASMSASQPVGHNLSQRKRPRKKRLGGF